MWSSGSRYIKYTYVSFTILTLICCIQVFKTEHCDSPSTELSSKEYYLPSEVPLTCEDVVSDEPRVVAVLAGGLKVLCDTQTDGGGWLVIQRRVTGVEFFSRNWADYKDGFGDLEGDFWFGNEKIHRLTNQRRHELRVDLSFQGDNYFATYSHFRLFGEPKMYKLEVTGYRGDAGDSFSYHSGKPFSTEEKDHDESKRKNCAESFHGGWWYGDCHQSNLNGWWGSKAFGEGLTWMTLTDYYDTVEFVEMKIRPVK